MGETSGKSFERTADVNDLDVVSNALRAAKDEIHNPGFARANNYDVLDMIDQARAVIHRAIAASEPDDPDYSDPQRLA